MWIDNVIEAITVLSSYRDNIVIESITPVEWMPMIQIKASGGFYYGYNYKTKELLETVYDPARCDYVHTVINNP